LKAWIEGGRSEIFVGGGWFLVEGGKEEVERRMKLGAFE